MLKKFLNYLIFLTSFSGLIYAFGIENGKFDWREILYFTIISNVLVFILYSLKLIGIIPENKAYFAQLIVTLNITLTGIVYIFILAPAVIQDYGMGAFLNVGNFSLHVFTLILVFIDWFTAKKSLNYSYAWKSLWVLVLYLIYSETGTYLKIKIPPYGFLHQYFFLNPDKVGGISGVVFYCFVVSMIFVAIGYILIFISKRNDK